MCARGRPAAFGALVARGLSIGVFMAITPQHKFRFYESSFSKTPTKDPEGGASF